MDETTIPLEAGIETRAISMTKGCYVGQEVIVRVLHRGHGRVAKKLVGVILPEAAAAERGAIITGDGKAIGSLTSIAWSPRLQRPVALGYVQRDFVAPGTVVMVDDQSGRVAALPFAAEAVSR
jgi:folate-binding protein YgfZ